MTWQAGAGALMSGGLIGQGLSFGLNQISASKAHDRAKNMMTRGPGYRMEGLRAAGLNPILAASGGLSGPPTPVSQAHAASGAKGGDPLVGAQKRLINQQTSAALAQEVKSTSEANLNDVRKELEALDFPRRKWMEDFYKTDAGQQLILLQLTNDALPNSVAGGAFKAAYSLKDQFMEVMRAFNASSTTPRMP